MLFFMRGYPIRRVDATHYRLCADTLPECLPEGQGSHEDESMRRRADDGAKIGSEGEERTGNGLCGAIAREKSIVAHPTRRHNGFAQQRQHHMTAAEDQRARAVERFEESYGLR